MNSCVRPKNIEDEIFHFLHRLCCSFQQLSSVSSFKTANHEPKMIHHWLIEKLTRGQKEIFSIFVSLVEEGLTLYSFRADKMDWISGEKRVVVFQIFSLLHAVNKFLFIFFIILVR